MIIEKKNIQYLSGRRFSPEWNSDLGDEFDYKNKLIDNLISDLYKNNGENMTLNQYQTLLDKLWSLLRISHSFDKEGNYVKNERVTAVYKNK